MDFSKLRGMTAALGKAAFAVVDGASTYNIGTAIDYCIGGLIYSKGTVSGGATPVVDGNTGKGFVALQPLQGCCFVWALDAAGAVALLQGPMIPVDEDTGRIEHQATLFPGIPSTHCPIAFHVVQTAADSDEFIAGTSNWNATGITDLVVDVATLPTRPPNVVTA